MRPTLAVSLAIAVLTSVAAPAGATTITLNFTGAVDLTFFGGPASSTFQGSVTWDSATAPFATTASSASYSFLNAIFTLNSTDFTSRIIAPTTSSLVVSDNAGGVDYLQLNLRFSPKLDLGPGEDISLFFAVFPGPTTMFASTALPSDLAFLSLLNKTGVIPASRFDNEQDPRTFVSGSLIGTAGPTSAVPEPSTLLLLSAGLGRLALSRRRRKPGRSI
jgi:PEP-CTERM motif-containing protein